ncbi:MAG: LysM peptidoglycan-binding domain-containing protein [Pontiellaceae bacterium]
MMRYLLLLCGTTLLFSLTACDSRSLTVEEREERIDGVVEARELMEAGRYQEAEHAYKQALDENPLIARPHLDLATIYQQHIINHIHAIYHYDRYLELRPETQKRAIIQEQRLKVARRLAQAFLNNTPEVKRLMDENAHLKAEVARLKKVSSPTTFSLDSDRKKMELNQKNENKYTIYHVRSGDTLSRIAKRFYDDPSRWEQIYQANRDSLQSPSGIRVGQTLVIPK